MIFGFCGFSLFVIFNVVVIVEGILFIELMDWDYERLYVLKGEVMCCGVEVVIGIMMLIYEKCWF